MKAAYSFHGSPFMDETPDTGLWLMTALDKVMTSPNSVVWGLIASLYPRESLKFREEMQARRNWTREDWRVRQKWSPNYFYNHFPENTKVLVYILKRTIVEEDYTSMDLDRVTAYMSDADELMEKTINHLLHFNA